LKRHADGKEIPRRKIVRIFRACTRMEAIVTSRNFGR
jgi:hypothetical protein